MHSNNVPTNPLPHVSKCWFVFLVIFFFVACSRLPDVHNCRQEALSYEKEGRYTRAIEALNRCLLKVRDAELFVLRGKNHMYLGNYVIANSDLDSAIALQPDLIAAHFYKGECLYNRNNFDSSIYYLSKSLEMKFHKGNGVAYDFQPGFSSDPFEIQTSVIRYQRGLSYYELEKDSLALLDFSIAADENYRLKDTYLYMGALNIHMGNAGRGCTFLRLAMREGNQEAEGYLKQFCEANQRD